MKKRTLKWSNTDQFNYNKNSEPIFENTEVNDSVIQLKAKKIIIFYLLTQIPLNRALNKVIPPF